MSLINCPECQKEVSTDAIACPSCGKSLRKPPSVWKWVLGVPVAVLFLMYLYGVTMPTAERDALAQRRLCESQIIYGKSQYECDKLYESVRNRK